MKCSDFLWCPALEPVTLHDDEVHVWRAFLDLEPTAVLSMQGTLSDDEKARAEQFYSRSDGARYIAARGVLRALLGRYLGTGPGDLRFCYGTHGKPALAPLSVADDLRFNVSHSLGLALFAFARHREVGVDVEYVEPRLVDDRRAARFLSPREVSSLSRLPRSARTEAFFNCWTRKEAYLKARGGGLSMGLDSFDFSLSPCEPAALLAIGGDPHETGTWSVRALAPGEGYAAAVAAEGDSWSLAMWDWARPLD